jgi:hypothetical protein
METSKWAWSAIDVGVTKDSIVCTVVGDETIVVDRE